MSNAKDTTEGILDPANIALLENDFLYKNKTINAECDFLITYPRFEYCHFNNSINITVEGDHQQNNFILFEHCKFKNLKITIGDDTQPYKVERMLFDNCTFDNCTITLKSAIFEKEIFKQTNDEESYPQSIEITNSIVKTNFIIGTDEDVQKEKPKRKFKNSEILEKAVFYNSTFKDLADFFNSEFQEVDFERTRFEDISAFKSVKFHQGLILQYVTFEKLAIFDKAIIKSKGLDLEETLFFEPANFLSIDALVANRETARIIKDSFEKNSNIIEANKYYRLEMEQREKELKKEKNFSEQTIFWFQKYSSNHSTSWNLAFTWIVLIGFVHFLLKYSCNLTGKELIFSSLIIFFSTIMNLKNDNFIVTLFISLFTFITMRFIDINGIHATDLFANLINPFSIMTGKETLTFIDLIFKTIYAYLIYQFIISVRQNTRRK